MNSIARIRASITVAIVGWLCAISFGCSAGRRLIPSPRGFQEEWRVGGVWTAIQPAEQLGLWALGGEWGAADGSWGCKLTRVSVDGNVERTVELLGTAKQRIPNDFRTIIFRGELLGFVTFRRSGVELRFHDPNGKCIRSVLLAQPIHDIEVINPAAELVCCEILVATSDTGNVLSVKDGRVSEWFAPGVIGMPPRRARVEDVDIAVRGTGSSKIILTTSCGVYIFDQQRGDSTSAKLQRSDAWMSRLVVSSDGAENLILVPFRLGEIRCVNVGGDVRWRREFDFISSGSYCVDVAASYCQTKIAVATRNGLVIVVYADNGAELGRFDSGVFPRILWRHRPSDSDEIIVCASHDGLIAMKPFGDINVNH
jgi:hypothetical protein